MTYSQYSPHSNDTSAYRPGVDGADDESLGRNRRRRAYHAAVTETGDPSEGDASILPVRPTLGVN